MTRFAILTAALLLAAPAIAQDAVPDETAPVAKSAEKPSSFDLAREKFAECAGQKFVFAWGIGAHPTKVTLCSNAGATTDEIVRMIDDAATKIEATTGIAEDRRKGLVQQMRAKIAELQGTLPAAELPKAKPIETATAPEARAPARAPAPEQLKTAAAPHAAAAAPVAAPRLSFGCINTQFPGGGPCVTLTRDTILTVRSGEALPGGVALRFVRQGDPRGEIALGAMRKGQTVRLNLPRPICSGVVSSEVEVEVVSGGQVVHREGPFLLRC